MTMNRILIAIGMVSIIAGLLWPWIKKVPLFHLPGDIIIDRPGLRFYFRRLAVRTYACGARRACAAGVHTKRGVPLCSTPECFSSLVGALPPPPPRPFFLPPQKRRGGPRRRPPPARYRDRRSLDVTDDDT